MEHHFQCTACGKCCYGQLPLTLADAFAHAERFPLALIWTPLREGSKDYAMVSRLGTTIPVGRKEMALLITPSAYIPPAFPCPALRDDMLCGIHANKPARCRTMPFYPYREEQYQAEMLKVRPGWACDTSAAAPVVFMDKKIIAREDFDLERQTLLEQVPQIRHYAAWMLKFHPQLADSLVQASLKAKAGQVVTSLSSFLTATRNPAAKQIAAQQLPVLNAFAAKTSVQKELAEYHRHYSAWAKEMSYLAGRS